MKTAFLALLYAACGAALGGCAQNAILELSVDVPADPTVTTSHPRFALVQAHAGDSFAAAWAGSGGIRGTALSATTTTTLHVSVVADDSMVQMGKLGVRVRFCGADDCNSAGDDLAPEVRYLFERAFYQGKVTRMVLAPITALPTAPPTATTPTPIAIAKCDVQGCVEGSTTSYCHADGTHFCER